MKFSISLPTCFEGVMYPIPFVEPGDFVRMAQLCEKLGYDSVWGNDHITSQHYVRELFPDHAPNFYELMTVLSFCAAATSRIRIAHRYDVEKRLPGQVVLKHEVSSGTK